MYINVYTEIQTSSITNIIYFDMKSVKYFLKKDLDCIIQIFTEIASSNTLKPDKVKVNVFTQ